MKGWLALGGFIGIIGLLVACWIYRGRIDADHERATVATMQHEADVARQKFDREQRANQGAAEVKEQRNAETAQSQLQQVQHDRDAAVDLNNRLRNAVTIYASQSVCPGTSGPACISIAEAESRIRQLASAVSLQESADSEDAADLGVCAVRLTYCEGWATTVEQEYGARKAGR